MSCTTYIVYTFHLFYIMPILKIRRHNRFFEQKYVVVVEVVVEVYLKHVEFPQTKACVNNEFTIFFMFFLKIIPGDDSIYTHRSRIIFLLLQFRVLLLLLMSGFAALFVSDSWEPPNSRFLGFYILEG